MNGLHRILGEYGNIAFDDDGFALAVPNADSPSEKAGPYSQNGEENLSHVASYFVDMGLPLEQKGDQHANALMADYGETAKPEVHNVSLRGYFGVIHRAVQGIRVEGSYAWARFNDRDEVVSEEVYWPAFPAEALGDATELKERLSQPGPRDAFLATLPEEVRSFRYEVIVVHSGAHVRPFLSLGVVEMKDPHGTDRYFDKNSREVMMLPPPSQVDSPK